MTPCYEIVTYTVDAPHQADAARSAARDLIRCLPGFLSWTAFSGARTPSQRADLVAWRSEADAADAAEKVAQDPAFAPFRATVAHLQSMDHYQATPAPDALASATGVEVGRFRLKPGVVEADMRRAYDHMVHSHLSRQAGWLRQHLVVVGEGRFIDLAFAVDRPHAEAICAAWAGHPACDAFLALIEPEDMTFGAIA